MADLIPTPTQDSRLIRFRLAPEDPKNPDQDKDLLLLDSFTGQEGISLPFHYDLALVSINPAIDFSRVIGKPATITIVLENGNQRYIHGIVSSFTQSGATKVKVKDLGFAIQVVDATAYQAALKPDLWRLTRVADCRIFLDQTAPQIIETILTENQVVYEKPQWDASRHPVREQCVQYSESDFRFISRLMEDEGILYWFRHDDKRHTLVLTDSLPGDDVPYQAAAEFRAPDTQDKSTGPSVTDLSVGQEVRPNLYTLRDFNFRNPGPKSDPGSNLEAQANAMTVSPGDGNDANAPKREVYDFPGYYEDPTRAVQVADLRMEEIESGKVCVTGHSTYRAFISAHVFALSGHYRNDSRGQTTPFANFNRKYLITSIFHQFSEGNNFIAGGAASKSCEDYGNSFQCIPYPTKPKEFVYRPTRVTQVPVIAGTQTATVVGPASVKAEDGKPAPKPTGQPEDQIYIDPDNFGRVRVRFHWDRQKKDGDTSCWVRVAQPWAHLGWGHQWIPRIGQEVVVTFLEGDPDRPLITGAVYNSDNHLPFSPDKYKTQSGIRTRSNPVEPNGAADKYNMLRFDDKNNCEQVFLRSQLRMDVRALGSFYETNGGDRHALIGWKDDKGQGGDFNITVGNEQNIHIQGAQYERIEKKLNFAVGQDAVQDFEANLATLVKSKAELNAKQIIVEASEKISLKVGSSFILIEPSGITIYGASVKINSGGWGVETSDPDIDDPLDASPADTGKPGYVDCSKRGKGGGGHHRRHLSAQHAASLPRAGEDPRMQSIRAALQNSAAGRHALEVYDRYGVTSSFTPGIGGGYDPASNNMNLDPSWGDYNNPAFVHEMNHAQAEHEKTTADINNTTRDQYVDQNLKEEAHGDALANQSYDELSQAGQAPTSQPPNSDAYRNGYNQGVQDYEATHPNATPEETDTAGRAAGEQAVLDKYRAGQVTTSNNGQDYRQYYGDQWDKAHPGASPGGGGP